MAYQSITGDYELGTFHLYIDHVQGALFTPHRSLGLESLKRKLAFPESYTEKIGLKQSQKKYTTVLMVKWMCDLIQSGKSVYREVLERKFPEESKQGTCVFSMTVGFRYSPPCARIRSKRGGMACKTWATQSRLEPSVSQRLSGHAGDKTMVISTLECQELKMVTG